MGIHFLFVYIFKTHEDCYNFCCVVSFVIHICMYAIAILNSTVSYSVLFLKKIIPLTMLLLVSQGDIKLEHYLCCWN